MEPSRQQIRELATALAGEFLTWIAEEQNRQPLPASEIHREEEVTKDK